MVKVALSRFASSARGVAFLLCLVFLLVAPAASGSPLFSEFSLGVGDRFSWDNPVGSEDYSNIRYTADLLADHGVSANQARYLTLWMVPEWQEFWFPAEEVQSQIIDRGFVPVFVHWWFGDDTRPSTIQAKEADYYSDLKGVGNYLRKLRGTVLLVLEPEFNTDPTEALNSWPGFSTVLLNGRATVAQQVSGSGVEVLYGTAPGPWDSAAALEPAMGEFARIADFLGVQSMYASTYNAESETLAGADLALERLTEYYAHYGKPTFIPYFVISSYDAATRSASGWQKVQRQAIVRFRELCPRLVSEAHTFGLSYMMLADDPSHHGFFGAAEYHFGLMDREFRPKPAFADLFAPLDCSPTATDRTPPDDVSQPTGSPSAGEDAVIQQKGVSPRL